MVVEEVAVVLGMSPAGGAGGDVEESRNILTCDFVCLLHSSSVRLSSKL